MINFLKKLFGFGKKPCKCQIEVKQQKVETVIEQEPITKKPTTIKIGENTKWTEIPNTHIVQKPQPLLSVTEDEKPLIKVQKINDISEQPLQIKDGVKGLDTIVTELEKSSMLKATVTKKVVKSEKTVVVEPETKPKPKKKNKKKKPQQKNL